MTAGRAGFGPVRLAWCDAETSPPASVDVLRRLGEPQVRRYEALSGAGAQRFLAGRSLLAELIAEFTDAAGLGFTTTCERCGAEHGRPRVTGAPVAISVSYAGSVVAVAAASLSDTTGVGVDIERAPGGDAGARLAELAPLFAPAPAPDLEGWTLLEAALKADGRGVRVDLAAVRVGEVGSGRLPAARAVRIPGRVDTVDAAIIPGPDGFVLTAAAAPAAPVSQSG
ncbi:hypothetical protein [Microbacterium sp.]|uniref:4'-phosphopantetheinyl transferase family protein n=1 Tax=Microbacterium sp. TaxID=51671 RepID=UPI002E2EA58B|nr:hypothetical protein [Microbacterium sp.]HEX5728507.1 hypothetical protein [Microbacterium sp.]